MNRYQKAALAFIESRGGRTTADELLAEAKAKKTANGRDLHGYFDWDDKSAGYKYRLDQARELLRSVKVHITTEHFNIEAPAIIRDPGKSSGEPGYISVARLRNDEDLAREAVVAEFARARDALTRAKSVALALGLSAEIDDLVKRIGALHERVQEQQVEGRA